MGWLAEQGWARPVSWAKLGEAGRPGWLAAWLASWLADWMDAMSALVAGAAGSRNLVDSPQEIPGGDTLSTLQAQGGIWTIAGTSEQTGGWLAGWLAG